MTAKSIAPYGCWKSPISAADIASASIGLGAPRLGADGSVYWLEVRPNEGGRYVVVRWEKDGGLQDLFPAPFSARTRVHEYGGGSFLVCGRSVIFTNFADQRLYRCSGESEPTPITPEGPLRYADFECDESRCRLVAVLEDHTEPGKVANGIAAVYPREDGRVEVLVRGNDFYAAPRLSPDGSQLAWLTWNHPNMPWDAAELWVAPVNEDGSLGEATHVAGGPEEAICEPRWSPGGVLHFVSDRSNWWNIYRWTEGKVRPVTEADAEFAGPAWAFGQSHYAFVSEERAVATYSQNGLSRMASIELPEGGMLRLDLPYTAIGGVRADAHRAVFVGGSASEPTSIVLMDLDSGRREVLQTATTLQFDPGYISAPEAVEFPTEGGKTAHGLFYAPKNQDYEAPEGEKPPLVVMVHGGPTAATSTAMRLGIQFYTSRGIAVLDVNYGGSTGYGRAYRRRLYGQWGVVDVDDACNGAKRLAERGLVDGGRLAITGGSAGGYTTLACLTFRNVFAAGASHFGVSDCELLAQETHKFESRYLDKLIGPYPDRRDLYVKRSPIHHLGGLNCPVIFFQGLEDEIVPPNQAETMYEALKNKGVATAYLPFAGEQHGFRRAENIRRAIEAELLFFGKVLGFEPADEIEPVQIENL